MIDWSRAVLDGASVRAQKGSKIHTLSERGGLPPAVGVPAASEPGPAAPRTQGRFRAPQHQDTSATLAGRIRSSPKVEVRGPYSKIKDQLRALEELHEKLPSLDIPEPSLIKQDRPRRARQLRADQVEQLIADYRSGATVYELGDRFGIER